jgi:signal transduction histidine kinase
MPWFSFRSLRGKLQVFALLLTVGPGVLLALIAYASAREGLERTAARQLTEVAHDTLDEVTEAVATAQKDLGAWARQDVMRDVIIGDLDKRIARILRSLVDGGAPFLSLVCVDSDGRVVAASDPRWAAEGREDEAVRTALGGGEFRGEPAPARDGAPRSVELAVPIRDPERPQMVVGALVGHYDWDHAIGMATRIRHSLLAHGLNLDLLVLDSAGTVVGEVWRDDVQPDAGEMLRRAAMTTWHKAAPGGARGWMTMRQAGALAGWERADGTRGGWQAVAMEPLAEALAPVYSMRRRIGAALALVLVGALVIARGWAGRLSRPLRELTRATQEIARAGEVPRPVEVRSRDEIGTLATSFNTMASALARAQEDLLAAAKFAFIGEVASGIAHEVRTPLGIMRGSAQMLARAVPPDHPECGELAQMIIGEVDRLDRVVAGLLELARPRQPSFEPTRLGTVLARALDFLDGQAREKQIVMRQELETTLPLARCDPEQIYQVALNLVLNALQILPAGAHVTVRTVHGNDGSVGFEVEDDGPGIPPDLRERIFTPFFSRREGGTGLGLALVRRMVQAHQGTVTVESEVGRGTTFRVELPIAPRTA